MCMPSWGQLGQHNTAAKVFVGCIVEDLAPTHMHLSAMAALTDEQLVYLADVHLPQSQWFHTGLHIACFHRPLQGQFACS